MYISYCYVEINRQLWSDFRWKTLQGTSDAACNSTCGEGMHKLIIFPLFLYLDCSQSPIFP